MPAAAHIGEPAIAHCAGIIRVPRTRQTRKRLIIDLLHAARVIQKGAERRTGSAIVDETGKHLRKIELFALMRRIVRQKHRARSSRHKPRKCVNIDIFAGRDIIEHDTDRRPLRLTEQGYADPMIPN